MSEDESKMPVVWCECGRETINTITGICDECDEQYQKDIEKIMAEEENMTGRILPGNERHNPPLPRW